MIKQAPEIFQRLLTSLDLTGLPPTTDSGFEDAVIMQFAMQYAAKGWTAAVVVNDGMVRVVAVPQQGIEPRLTCLACSNTAISKTLCLGWKPCMAWSMTPTSALTTA